MSCGVVLAAPKASLAALLALGAFFIAVADGSR